MAAKQSRRSNMFVVEAILSRNKSWFRIKGGNGKIILTSETYLTIQKCRAMAKKIKKFLKQSEYKESMYK